MLTNRAAVICVALVLYGLVVILLASPSTDMGHVREAIVSGRLYR